MSKMFLVGFISLSLALSLSLLGCSGTDSATTSTVTSTTATVTTSTAAGTTTTTSSTSSTSTTTTSTTTTTGVVITANEVNSAKAASIMGNGGVTLGNTAAGIGQSGQLGANSINAFAENSGPPASFFTENVRTGSASIDGYVLASSEVAGGNISFYVRLFNASGDKIAGTFMNGKKVASLEGITLQGLMSNSYSPQQVETAISNFITAFNASPNPYPALFNNINTYCDYMFWAFIFPDIKSSQGIPVSLSTPEATLSEKFGSMEAKMVFQNQVSGEMEFIIPTSAEGQPRDGFASGSTTITTTTSPVITLEANISLLFSSGGPINIILNGITTPEDLMLCLNMNPITGAGTGVLSDETGSLIGTIEVGANGGVLYVGNTSEAFIF